MDSLRQLEIFILGWELKKICPAKIFIGKNCGAKGWLLKSGVIVINANQPIFMQKLTLLHEILHKSSDFHTDRSLLLTSDPYSLSPTRSLFYYRKKEVELLIDLEAARLISVCRGLYGILKEKLVKAKEINGVCSLECGEYINGRRQFPCSENFKK